MGLHNTPKGMPVADWLAQHSKFPGPQPGMTPTRRAVAILEKRLGRTIPGRLVQIEPQSLRVAVYMQARHFVRFGI